MKTKCLFLFFLLSLSGTCFAETPPCSTEAIAQAQKLLLFHSDGDDRAQVEATATELPSIENPTNSAQKFSVLEVMGHVYKGNYRIRLVYYRSGSGCTLMGQEILELANL